MKLSIIVPCYNEARSLATLHERLQGFCTSIKARHNLEAELIYIDDGSVDDTLTTLEGLKAEKADIQIVSFSRNFGKEAAMLAGLDAASPDNALLFMDGDGQHSPELALELVQHFQNGYDVAFTYKKHRRDESAVKNQFVKSFYWLINVGLRQKIPENAGDFRLLSPRAGQALRSLPERNRFFKGLSAWIGFRQIGVAYEPAARIDGTSKWSFWNLFAFSMEGITSFSVAPLRLSALVGAAIACFSIIMAFWILGETLIYGVSVSGYPSLFVGIMFLGGMQLLMIGIVGEYIGKILNELKARPHYLIAKHDIKLKS